VSHPRYAMDDSNSTHFRVVLGVLDIPLLAPTEAGALREASTAVLALLAARPILMTLIAAVLPFLTSAERAPKIATTMIIVVIGLTIAELLNGVARSAVRIRRSRPTTAY
jgi:hypothetical protein